MQFFPFFFIGTLCFGIMIGIILCDLVDLISRKETEVKKMSPKTFREFAELSLKNYREREEGLRT